MSKGNVSPLHPKTENIFKGSLSTLLQILRWSEKSSAISWYCEESLDRWPGILPRLYQKGKYSTNAVAVGLFCKPWQLNLKNARHGRYAVFIGEMHIQSAKVQKRVSTICLDFIWIGKVFYLKLYPKRELQNRDWKHFKGCGCDFPQSLRWSEISSKTYWYFE